MTLELGFQGFPYKIKWILVSRLIATQLVTTTWTKVSKCIFASMKFLFIASVLICLTHFNSFASAEVVEYTFDVHYISGAVDGVFKKKILAVNGLFPGPTIQAKIGDTLRVTLINNIQDGQNTTIHWHGIHQYGTPFEDGTSQISQCPLKAGHHQVYEFPLQQSGTYWYHAHVDSQYTEGLWGSLIIHNVPERYEYDDEILITLSDWYLRTAHDNDVWHLSPMSRGVPPYPDTGLLNARGRYNCTVANLRNFNCTASEQRRHIFNVTPGKTYRIRVINTGSYAPFRFSIDGHKLHTIEVDGIDTMRPVVFDVAEIAVAQRYSFLVTMNHDLSNNHEGRFLIRADLMKERLMLIEPENINSYPEYVIANVTAILKYQSEHRAEDDFDTEPHDYTEEIPPPPLENPKYLDENLLQPHDGILAPAYFDEEFVLSVTFIEDHEDIRRGSFNASPFKLPHHKPLLVSLMHDDEIPADVFPLYVHYGDVVQVVINNPFYGPHPFHLHGFSFWVMGSGDIEDGDYDPGRHTLILDGAKRDTVVVHELSWTVIRFVADNPGLWTLHCHNDWHNLSGMAMTFIVEAEMARQNYTIPNETKRICALHGLEI